MPIQIKNPQSPPERKGKRILLVRMSAIGDVIHALPVATALRKAQPDAFIAWVAEPVPAQILTRHPDIDSVIIIPRRLWKKLGWWKSRAERRQWVRQLRDHRFDIAVDLQGLAKSAHVARLSRAPVRYCFGDEQAREMSALGVPRENRITPPPEAKHVIERYLALAAPLGVDSLVPEWNFGPLPDEAMRWLSGWWPKQAGFAEKPWVALCPGAGWETKCWPVAHFATLAKRIETELSAQPIFIWGPADSHLRDELMRDYTGDKLLHLPENDLHQLRAFLGGCAAFVGGDTGPTHLAAALGVPCVSPHGGSDWERNGPLGDFHLCPHVEKTEVPCVPCWRTTCNYSDHLACMKRLAVETVLDGVKTVLGRSGRTKPPAELLAGVLMTQAAQPPEPPKLHKSPTD